MAKNIVICCDGTGNEVSAGEQTNVVKLYKCLDKSDPKRQIAFYDPGVGTLGAPGFQTPAIKAFTKLLGLAFGYGLAGNIKNAYTYLMRTYEDGDQIFLYGFSRGAYTVRALAGLIRMCGLLHKDSENLIDYAVKLHHSKRRGKPDWKGAARFKKYFTRPCVIHFLGIWDTVKSVGLFRRSLVLPYTANNNIIQHGRHAIALNEKRSKYRPNLWSYPDGEDFKQVWFTGVHSDIGGSYPEDGLSDVTLQWMIQESRCYELLIDDKPLSRIAPKPLGTLHNSLLPMWWVLGWRRRWLPERSLIHTSVRLRRELAPDFDKSCQRCIPNDVMYVD